MILYSTVGQGGEDRTMRGVDSGSAIRSMGGHLLRGMAR